MAFDPDRDAVLMRARAAGVGDIVVPATHRAGWSTLVALCAADARLHPALGLHPVFLARHAPDDLVALEAQVETARPVAIGECGLDFHVEGIDRSTQAQVFEGQLRLARAHDLPVIVHARRAVDAVIATLRRFEGVRGVVHSFSGSPEQARQLWTLGILVGIGGPVTYDRARRLQRLVATLPAGQLLLETDAPDQPGQARRGERHEPADLVAVCTQVAALRGETPDAVARATACNAVRLFGLRSA